MRYSEEGADITNALLKRTPRCALESIERGRNVQGDIHTPPAVQPIASAEEGFEGLSFCRERVCGDIAERHGLLRPNGSSRRLW